FQPPGDPRREAHTLAYRALNRGHRLRIHHRAPHCTTSYVASQRDLDSATLGWRRRAMRKPSRTRRAVVLGGTAALSFPAIVLGQAKPIVRIGVPTKTYFPTIIAETA